jgi:hypothetical protein
MSDNVTSSILDDYERERDWAPQNGISQRTAARYRGQGLPWLEWGGEIWIPKEGGQKFIASRVKQRKPPRQRDRRPP